ncbi:hypothetical protein [Deinococcus arcticus]|uniref:hypothetical protein n=1 Tax=Deinococcus arcticus TaxID=2136176 RepID=UPI001E3CF203|nr:hypothetical protein [Deinococcus arcticus]
MTFSDEVRAALLAEGDRLARRLTQTLQVTAADPPRLTLLGRSLALNLVGALLPTLEQVARHSRAPLRAGVTLDRVGAPQLQTWWGEQPGACLPVADLLNDLLLTPGGQWHPPVRDALQGALGASEHGAERALVTCLRSPPVLRSMERVVRRLLRPPDSAAVAAQDAGPRQD